MSNNPSFSFYANVFGFVVGSVSLLGLVVGLCRYHLPSNKIKILESLLHETENTLRKAVEEGLLVHEFVQIAENRLSLLRGETHSLSFQAHNAIDLRQDYAGFLNGTSTMISRTCKSLKKLKAEVVTSSEENRQRRAQMNPALQITVSPSRSEPEHPPIPQHPTEIALPPPVYVLGSSQSRQSVMCR